MGCPLYAIWVSAIEGEVRFRYGCVRYRAIWVSAIWRCLLYGGPLYVRYMEVSAIWGVRYMGCLLYGVSAIAGVRYREVFAIWGVRYMEVFAAICGVRYTEVYLLYGVSL